MSHQPDRITIKSKRDWRLSAFFYAVCLFIISVPAWQPQTNSTFFIWMILGLVVAMLLWFLHGTSYAIQRDHFHYKSGFIRGKIAIKDIKSITLNETMWAGLKPATALNGVIIRYGFASEIYVSPVNNETFANQLLKINPRIEVHNHAK